MLPVMWKISTRSVENTGFDEGLRVESRHYPRLIQVATADHPIIM
jgi:predicted DNA-binding ribbon-helix-helix protein